MATQIVCDPLLGQTSVVTSDTINFTVVLATSQPDRCLQRQGSKAYGVHFTVKYRAVGDTWQWENDQSGSGDGEVIFARDDPLSDSLAHHFKVSDQFFVATNFSQGAPNKLPRPRTRLWSLSCSVPSATTESSISRLDLGLPELASRWFCLARESKPWLCPRQGRGKFAPAEDAILVSFQRRDGRHIVLLALSLQDILSVFRGDSNGNIILVARNDRSTPGTAQVLIAVSETFEEANTAVINHAKTMVGAENSSLRMEIQSMAEDISPRSLESWYDGFAYCTWNGLGQTLTPDRIFHALDTMNASGIKFSNLIIDDNWQSIDDFGPNNFHHRWIEFEADRKTFPQGLKNTITSIKDRYPSIQHIAVWHGIFGYWNGIAPDGALAKRYKTKILKKQEVGFFGGGSLTAVDASDAFALYADFYKFLVDCGVDSVKTDNQFLLDQLDDAPDRFEFISTYQDAWMKAATRHFAARAISCMSQIPQILFHSQLLPTLPRLMARNSEDFFPDVASSHPWHIFCNAHTSTLTQHLNVLPDWDMFQTSHEYSAFHAAARCISGGPIYFTDKPGEHDIGLIRQMTAQSFGETIVLRPKVARTTYVYASSKEKRLLRINTSTIHTTTPMLGIFNINSYPVTEILKLAHFEDLSNTDTYIIRAHTSGYIGTPSKVSDDEHVHLLSLDVKGYEILTAYPLQALNHPKTNEITMVSVLGLVDKMTGAAAVLSSSIRLSGNKLLLDISLKAFGQLGIYLSGSKTGLEVGEVSMCDVPLPGNWVSFDSETNLVQVDMEGAWERMKNISKASKIVVSMIISWG
ncbi:hypothetical protein IFR05_001009 [Cadophora sp. M221]|nr:hypothetical protein IFR05_001009 [Cadophora sp. M221]